MKEVQFIRRNIERWKDTEAVIETAGGQSPDKLADVYIELTGDLAFAQTHFPNSRITVYLNNLASALHNEIYRYKREKWSRVLTFWTQEVPDIMWKERKLLLASFLIFILSVLVGIVSTLGDETFPRLILGSDYMDMTMENIRKGTPMAVYDSDNESKMFLGITINNIMVSFNIFISGIFTSFCPGFLLMQNGIMVGTFTTFFYQQGMLGESLLAIMLHGTLELSSIVVSGAAGLAMGNGWLFPGTYSRLSSFRMGARRGLKIVVGTVPLFIIAGFIEGYVTRHTEVPDIVRLSFIVLSALFVIFYFVILPYKRSKDARKKQEDTPLPNT